MTLDALLADLRRFQVHIGAEGDQLRVRGPKGALTPELTAALGLHKVELLARLRASAAAREVPPPLSPVPRDRPLPLSFAQERLWFLDQFEGGSATYNMPVALRISGALRPALVARALTEVVRRHEALRTTFPVVDGEPIQRIAPAGPVDVPVVDLEALPTADRLAAAARLMDEQARRPFDLVRGPLVRAALARLGSDDHIAMLTMHHIVSDGWSMGVFVREMTALYGAYAGGAASPLPEPAIQYADFAVWQRQWLRGATLEAKLAALTARLAGAPPMLELPTDRPRPAVQTFRGRIERLHLAPTVVAALRQVGQAERATLFMTLLAAFGMLMARWSDQTDVVVGSPVANRGLREVASTIGFFANTLALRVDLSGDPTFRELLARVRETALEAYEHQDLPFERLVGALQPSRDLSHPPVCQVAFWVQDPQGGPLEIPGLSLEPIELDTVTAKFDLAWRLEETDRGVDGIIEYNTDLFDAATLQRMIRQFGVLTAAIAVDPSRVWRAYPLMNDAERQMITVAWNATSTEYPRDRCVHQLFEDEVLCRPNDIAVECGDLRLTYAGLNARANRLARALRARGVGPDVLVGVHLPRSLEAIVAMLGVLKAGGAYVPLDPAYPRARLDAMVRDAHPRVIVSARASIGQLTPHGADVVLIDAVGAAFEAESDRNLPCETTADSLAYVMYTSGSTGTPKGVEILHRGIVRLVRNTDYVAFTPAEVFLQLTSIAFDVSTFEIWGSLLNGARLAVFDAERLTFEALGDSLVRHDVTTLFLTPSVFNQIMELHPEALASLRQLVVGGDALSPPHVNRALERLPGVRLVNGYGPTEITTFAVCMTIASPLVVGRPAPIGRPIANTRAYVLDGRLEPSPIGVPGELYVGGDGVARGYLHQPVLTAERFIPDPFGARPGDRLYRTGDRARWLEDGTLQFLGRRDRQVKLRGFRVELGEVEAALAAHPDVREALVTTGLDAIGEKTLVGYVVPRAAAPPPDELRRFLGDRLPGYMVPWAFVTLPSVPLSPHGKIDWRALPAPAGPRADRALTPPRTETERAIAEIWRELLAADAVGIHDNFFDVGGHSLLLARCHTRLVQQFGTSLSLIDCFRFPTIHALAERISHPAAAAEASDPSRRAEARAAESARRAGRRQIRQASRASSPRVTPHD